MNLVDLYCNTTQQKLLKYEQVSKSLTAVQKFNFNLEHKIRIENGIPKYTLTSNADNRFNTITY